MSILSYEFMQRAFLASFMMSIIAPMLGVFLIIRRQSLMADTLSHVSLAGVALGFFLKLNPSFTTLFIVVIAATILEYLRTVYRTYSEVSTAILMSGGLALALILMSMNRGTTTVTLDQYLFGSIVTISWEQVILLVALFIILVVLFVLFRRPMYVLTFDESTAHVDGLPVTFMSILFNVITGVAISVMIPIAGALLVSAIMILPAAIGMRIGKSFLAVIASAIVIGMIGMMSGLFVSFYLEKPSGASITLIFIGIFLLVNVLKRASMLVKRRGNA